MNTIEEIIAALEKAFVEMEFTIGKRIYGKCIIAKKSTYCGAAIFVTNNSIVVEAAIPETKTRLLIGGGAILLKLFAKNYTEPSLKIYAFLSNNYANVQLRK